MDICSVFLEKSDPVLYDEESGKIFEKSQISAQLYIQLLTQKLLPEPGKSDFNTDEKYDTETYEG